MAQVSKFNRFVMILTLVVVLANAYMAHVEQTKFIEALATHQAHTIHAFGAINELLATGILKRVEAQRDKDEQQAKERGVPQPTPQVITKTQVKTKYLKRPTPKPFKWFSPD